MELYYTEPENIFTSFLRINGSEAHHISKVMRHKIGEMLYVTDGIGNEYQTMIKKIDNKLIEASILNQSRNTREPRVRISLAQSVIKISHMDLIVEKSTELGVHDIIPIISHRTIARISETKIERYQKVMMTAMKTSIRTHLPHISKSIKFNDLLQIFKNYDQVILAYEDEKKNRLADIISNNILNRILLIIGPEGGFTNEEIDQAINNNAKCITIGQRRLRSETAAIAALSLLLYQLKEM